MAHFLRPFQPLRCRPRPGMNGTDPDLSGFFQSARRKRAVSVRSFRLPACFCNIKTKYVNMADINLTDKASAKTSIADRRAGTAGPAEPIWDIIELLFFAYRDFVGDPDEVLLMLGFGRAHHRVLHFVNRNPGIKVADLLEILNITKQSLGRVLKQLIDQGYVSQKEGAHDRRQRLLYVTPKGETLA